VYVKRAASRILMQFASFAQGQNQVSETLLHDLLFFCAQASGATQANTPHLVAVRKAYGLETTEPVNYQLASLGRYDPSVLAQARKRINSAKESWSLYSGGDASRARQVVDQFGLIGDSLLKLHPASTGLAQALLKAADQAAHDPAGVRPELAMEVATTTLYLEAAFEDFDPSDAEMTERTQALAERLERVRAGAPAQPLDPWMEQLYRRVSDRQTMGSVVGELKVSLGEAEKSLDQFFRAPNEKGCLHNAVSQLAQMRGVLSVLGLDQAVQTVVRMRATVDQMLDTEVDKDQAREAGTFQQLGNNLSALSFLVDMLNYQPLLAKKLFVFDQDKGELLPLMGRNLVPDTAQPFVPSDIESPIAGVPDVPNGSPEGWGLADGSLLFDGQALQPDVVLDAGSTQAELTDVVGVPASVELSQAVPPASATIASTPVSEDSEEDELLDIFLEEAREVVGNGLEAVRLLKMQPANLEDLTTLRRAFHTLKGSSRMVGLAEFGEAAWAMEQLVNAALAEQRPAHAHMLSLSGDAMDALSRWVEDIAAHADAAWAAQPFRTSAEAWRNHSLYVPLDLQVPVQEVRVEAPAIDPLPVVSAPVAALVQAPPQSEVEILVGADALAQDLTVIPLETDSISAQGTAPTTPHLLEEPTEPAPVDADVEAGDAGTVQVDSVDMSLFDDVSRDSADMLFAEGEDPVQGSSAFEEIHFGNLEALSSSKLPAAHEEPVPEEVAAPEGDSPSATVGEPVSALSSVLDGLSLDLDAPQPVVPEGQAESERFSDNVDFDLAVDDLLFEADPLPAMVADSGVQNTTDEPVWALDEPSADTPELAAFAAMDRPRTADRRQPDRSQRCR
jgi:chemosensory pili system protein ChpA (sensor histidine kinase/response regulator)